MSWSKLEEFIVPESLAKMMDKVCSWEQAEFDNVPSIEIDDKILEKVCKANSFDKNDIKIFRECVIQEASAKDGYFPTSQS